MTITWNDIKECYWVYYPLDDNAKNYVPYIVLEVNQKCETDGTLYAPDFNDGISLIKVPNGGLPLYYTGVKRFAMTPTGDFTTTVYRNYMTKPTKGIVRFNYNGDPSNVAWYDLNGNWIIGDGRYIDDSHIDVNHFYGTCAFGWILHFTNDYYIYLTDLYLIEEVASKLKREVDNDVKGFCNKDYTSFKDLHHGNRSGASYRGEWDAIARHILKVGKRKNPENPYDGGDDKGDDDNNSGDYDHTSDPVPEPDLPSVSVTDSGLVTLFAPTESQLKALADYLWSDAFSLDNFKKMLNNPMDCILGLTIVPVNVPRGSAREITVGNIVTTVSCNICPTQYVKVDCGTFTFDRHNMTNSYLDYAPYSKCYLYLPFIGVQEINIDDFMQSTMHVVYHVDILTGAMFCYVMRGDSVMYTYMGQCAENVPLSSSSYSNTIGSIMSAAASIVGVASVVATGGASAPVAAGLLTGATTSTANAVSSLKPSVAHSGSIGGGAGIMGVNYPYLIFNTPHVSIPSQQRHYTGYPSNQIVKLSALSGFNIIQAINLSVSGANDSEMNEIESILKGGVIL